MAFLAGKVKGRREETKEEGEGISREAVKSVSIIVTSFLQ
jgi:hypothetical protein